MNQIPLTVTFEESKWGIEELMRRAVDGTVIPIFVDYSNNRVIIGGTSSLGSGAPLQVQSGDVEITTSGNGLILKDDSSGGTKTCRLTVTYDASTGTFRPNFTPL